MKHLVIIIIILGLCSCSMEGNRQPETTTPAFVSPNEAVISVKGTNGKYNLDTHTSEYLHLLQNTVTNFRDIAKKRNPQITIYNEFSVLLSRDMEYIISNCAMQGEGHDALHAILEKMAEQNKLIAGTDIDRAKGAFQEVLSLLSELETTFEFSR
jgi:hypothetical protein